MYLSLWPFLGIFPVSPGLSCTRELQSGHSTPDMTSPVPERKAHIPQPTGNA